MNEGLTDKDPFADPDDDETFDAAEIPRKIKKQQAEI